MNQDIFALVLAGGSGTRFWPKSRQKIPKQLCAIGSRKTLIEETLDRLDGYIAAEKRFIVTHKDQIQKTKEVTFGRCSHLIAEPFAKNTAAALTLAALDIERRKTPGTSPIMISFHADHIIKNQVLFQKALREAVSLAKMGRLGLIGITPRAPETGFGYIEKGTPRGDGFDVASFREKPDLKTATEFLETKRFLWNTGLFVWETKTFLAEMAKHMPTTFGILSKLERAFGEEVNEELLEAYEKLPEIAVDHGVLEKSSIVSVVEAGFDWQDVGSWSSLAECFGSDVKGNYIDGPSVVLESEGCTIESDGPLVGVVGLRDMVVVASGGAILVCPKERAQDVKKIVAELKAKQKTEWV